MKLSTDLIKSLKWAIIGLIVLFTVSFFIGRSTVNTDCPPCGSKLDVEFIEDSLKREIIKNQLKLVEYENTDSLNYVDTVNVDSLDSIFTGYIFHRRDSIKD